jgi:RNA polymerase sigma-70 factor (ECF subfamily)
MAETDINANDSSPSAEVTGSDRMPIDAPWSHDFDAMRERLERIVAFRMDPSMNPRLDPSDVVQESFFEVQRRWPEYQRDPSIPFFVWVRQRVLQTMIDMQRGHCREKRSVHREQHMADAHGGSSTSMSLAHWLMDDITSPSQVAIRREEREQLQSALDAMNETDREILAMRHFEHLSNAEAAHALGLSPTAASNRYVRAAAKLAELLQRVQRGASS